MLLLYHAIPIANSSLVLSKKLGPEPFIFATIRDPIHPHHPMYCIKNYLVPTQFNYSLRPIILFANTDISITKMYLDTSTLAKSIMGRRKYVFLNLKY
jgi:hypothetical protein